MSEQPESVTITLTVPPGHSDWQSVIHWMNKSGWQTVKEIAAQIEAQLPKPKPEEPKNIGAVVEDRGGMRWVRFTTFDDGCHWAADGHGDWAPYATNATYDQINVVKILSEGVPE